MISKNKKKQIYEYKPSFQAKEETYINYIKHNFQPLCIKFIKDKSLISKEEKEYIFNEFNNIKKYLKKWIFYEIKEDYNKKNNLQKKLETLYYKLKNIYSNMEKDFDSFFSENLEMIIENSIFNCLGIDGNKAFHEITEKSNILYWCHSIIFYKLLSFLDNEVLKYQNINSISIEYNDKYKIETKLQQEDWDKMVQEIINEEEFVLFVPSDIKPILTKFLLAIKDNKYSLEENEFKQISPYMDILVEILKKKKKYYEEILFF